MYKFVIVSGSYYCEYYIIATDSVAIGTELEDVQAAKFGFSRASYVHIYVVSYSQQIT